jgi:hypothetical protein
VRLVFSNRAFKQCPLSLDDPEFNKWFSLYGQLQLPGCAIDTRHLSARDMTAITVIQNELSTIQLELADQAERERRKNKARGK